MYTVYPFIYLIYDTPQQLKSIGSILKLELSTTHLTSLNFLKTLMYHDSESKCLSILFLDLDFMSFSIGTPWSSYCSYIYHQLKPTQYLIETFLAYIFSLISTLPDLYFFHLLLEIYLDLPIMFLMFYVLTSPVL